MKIKGMIKRNENIMFLINNIFNFTRKTYMFFCNKFYGVDNKSIVFISFGGKSYSDNPRSISEKLNEANSDFKIIWLFIDIEGRKDIVPSYVTCIKVNSIKALKALATSKIWVDNFNKPLYTYKSKEQIYIQTWHGDKGFKKILHDSTFKPKHYKLFESNSCDLAIAGSNYGEMQYKSAFKYKGDILKKGYPRNDILVENNFKKKLKIKNLFKIQKDVKILLYAPTLRRESSQSKQQLVNIDLLEVITTLQYVTNDKWVCLIRAHSAVDELTGIPSDNRFKDVSNYEDMNQILLISDLLITDYSSSAGDYALLNRPIILFQSDRNEYLEKDRTLYFDIDSSPFEVAMNQSELINFIKKINVFDSTKNCKEILKFYGSYETGESSNAVVNYILSNLKDVE